MLGFTKNIGLIDRIARVLSGSGILFIALKNVPSLAWSFILALIAIYFIVTGLLGRSPFYNLLGMHSDERIN